MCLLSLMSTITAKVYSEKYTIGYIVNAHNKHTNTQCDYIKDYMLGFFFLIVF
jgi:hypothetical protein